MADEDKDPLEEFALKVKGAQAMIVKSQASPDNLRAHMSNTVLQLVLELTGLVASSRDGVIDYVEERMADVMGEETQIVAEDAEKLLALIVGTSWLAEELEKVLQDDGAKARLEDLKKLAAECKEIVTESRLDDDEDGDAHEPDPAKVN